MEYSSDDIRNTLVDGLTQLGLRLDDLVVEKAVDYFLLLLARNKSVNLVSPKQDIQTQIVVHLVDSFSLLLIEGLPHRLSALDFGSGGGLPAIPLSLVFFDWHYTLVESTGKKAAFLSLVKDELSLNNVEIINRFLEPGANPENVVYDLVTARAVSDIGKLAAIVGPRLKRGGLFIAFKGPQGQSEIDEAAAELKKRRLCLIDKLNFVLPLVDAHRSLFIFKKI